MKHKAIPKKIRQQVYSKYNGRCAYCGCNLECKDMQVDHIESVYMAVECLDKEVDDSLANYMPACKSCNYYKNTGTIEDFRERIKNTLEHTCIDTFQARLAIKYGIIEFKPWNGEFYFEKKGGNIMNKEFVSIVKAENPFWNCVCARIRSTGVMIMVRNIHAFEPDVVPEWVQIGANGIELRHFKQHELEF